MHARCHTQNRFEKVKSIFPCSPLANFQPLDFQKKQNKLKQCVSIHIQTFKIPKEGGENFSSQYSAIIGSTKAR